MKKQIYKEQVLRINSKHKMVKFSCKKLPRNKKRKSVSDKLARYQKQDFTCWLSRMSSEKETIVINDSREREIYLRVSSFKVRKNEKYFYH